MDLWSMIPIRVHHYTILSTIVSLIPLGNNTWKESYLVISNHHSILQLTYITQAWMFKFNTYAMQANIWNAHSNASSKFPKILVDPFPLPCLSPYVIYQDIFMFLSLYDISPPFSLFLLLSLFLSPFVINDHKGSKYR